MLAKNPDAKVSAYDHPNGTTTFAVSKSGEASVLSGSTKNSNDSNSKEESDFVGYTNQADDNKDAIVGYVKVGVGMDGADPDSVFKTIDATARASVFHVANNEGHPISQYSADILTAKAGAGVGGMSGGSDGFPCYAGADANLNLFDLKASVFDAQVGLSAQTDVGLKNYSVGGHVLGAGFSVGKRCSISTPFGGIGIDFGRFFD